MTTSADVFDAVKRSILSVLPDLDPARIVPETSLRDLGANSLDRADIVIQAMESLRVKAPPHELAAVRNLQGLVDLLRQKTA